MNSTNNLLQLIIRATNNKHVDLEIQISPVQTVLDLKQQIQLNHPTKPVRTKRIFRFEVIFSFDNSDS